MPACGITVVSVWTDSQSSCGSPGSSDNATPAGMRHRVCLLLPSFLFVYLDFCLHIYIVFIYPSLGFRILKFTFILYNIHNSI